MATRRRMTVDDLLGPELSAEFDNTKTLGSEDPTLANKPAEPKPKAQSQEPSKPVPGPPPAELFPDLSHTAPAGTPLDVPKGNTVDEPLNKNDVPAAPKPSGLKVPLPPQPGGSASRGPIPSVTPKKKIQKNDIESLSAGLPRTADPDAVPTKVDYPVPDSIQAKAAGFEKDGDAFSLDGLVGDSPQAKSKKDPSPAHESPLADPDAAAVDALGSNDGPDSLAALDAGDDPEHGPVTRDALAAMGRPPFPKEEVRLASRAVGSWFRRVPMSWRIGLLAIPIVLLALLTSVVILLDGGNGTYQAFVTDDHTLLATPSVDVPLPHGDILERNEEVAVLEVSGTFALVSNPEGRTGWVQQTYLSKDAPPVTSERDFTLCFKRYNETDLEPCKARAQAQQAACLESCADKADPTPCQVDCKILHDKCESTCTMQFHELHAPPPPEPEPEPVTVEAVAEPTAEPDAVTEEVDESKASKKKRKRKKRKKRKKSR